MKLRFDLPDALRTEPSRTTLMLDEPMFFSQEGVSGTLCVDTSNSSSDVLFGAVVEIRLQGQ